MAQCQVLAVYVLRDCHDSYHKTSASSINIIYEAEQKLQMGYCVACGLVLRLDRDRKEGMYLK